jgi:hypothetical protein
MTFDQFYRDLYLPRHPTGLCKILHLIGLPASMGYVGIVIWLRDWWLLLLLPVPAYLFGWLGHLWARNHPTFFTYPVWSFRGYWKMIAGMLLG